MCGPQVPQTSDVSLVYDGYQVQVIHLQGGETLRSLKVLLSLQCFSLVSWDSRGKPLESFSSQSVVSHLSLVPLEVWEEYKAHVWVRVFVNYPLNLSLLLQDVANPLSG